MSRGIDLQILAAKAQELSAERARAGRQGDLQGQQAALRARERVEQERQRAGRAAKIEDARIRTEIQEGSGGGAHTPQERRKKDEQSPPPGQELLELPVERGEKTRKKSHTFDQTV